MSCYLHVASTHMTCGTCLRSLYSLHTSAGSTSWQCGFIKCLLLWVSEEHAGGAGAASSSYWLLSLSVAALGVRCCQRLQQDKRRRRHPLQDLKVKDWIQNRFWISFSVKCLFWLHMHSLYLLACFVTTTLSPAYLRVAYWAFSKTIYLRVGTYVCACYSFTLKRLHRFLWNSVCEIGSWIGKYVE